MFILVYLTNTHSLPKTHCQRVIQIIIVETERNYYHHHHYYHRNREKNLCNRYNSNIEEEHSIELAMLFNKCCSIKYFLLTFGPKL